MAMAIPTRTSTEHLSHGLDRAAFKVYAHAERHLASPLLDKREEAASPISPEEHGQNKADQFSRNNLRRISDKVKTKTGEIFHPRHKKQKSLESTTVPTLAPPPSKTDDDDRMFNPAPEQKGPDFKEVVKHPIDTIQSAMHGASGAKFAEALDNQVIAHGAEVKIVRAYDDVKSAETEEAKTTAMGNLEDLKKERQDAFVRWTIDRHVLKVRQVPPRTISQPRREDYKSSNKDGEKTVQWLEYGHDLLRFYLEHYGDQHIDRNPHLPEPSEEAINTSMERLVMTSTPYQMLIMKIRHIYRWENKYETAFYLGAYTFLWAVNYLAGTLMLSLIALVLRRRLYPPNLEDIREDIKRSEDVDMTALNLTQMIEQYGSQGWFGVLRKDLGPWLLLQTEDLTNVLEIWRNFYEWRDPKRTTISLILLVQAWLSITLVPLSVMVKAGQFFAGIVFFGLFPIASRYPQYRLLASPMKWLFWKIPTDAEWAIARLQVEANHRKQTLRDTKSSSEDERSDPVKDNTGEDAEPEVNIGQYHCTTENHHGDLCVTSRSVKYKTAIRSHILWDLKFDDITLLQKVGAGEGMLFVTSEGENYRVSGLKLRNEVFTQIIGYSGLRWQVTG